MEKTDLKFAFDKANFAEFKNIYDDYDGTLSETFLEVGDFADSDGDVYSIGFFHNVKNNSFVWEIYYDEDIVLFPEPNFYLNPDEFEKVKKYIKRLEKKNGRTNEI